MSIDRPRWIVFAGCVLAFLSAAANAGFLIHLGTSVSHLTGDVSKVAVEAVRGNPAMIAEGLLLAVATLSFVGGAMAAGFFIHHPNLDVKRPYGRSFVAIGLCLLVAHFNLGERPLVAVGLAGFAFGMQNALATRYRGMVLRTTHLTGLFTDLGVNLGMRLKGHRVAGWKWKVPGSLILCFFFGSAFGACIVLWLDLPFALLLAITYIAGGIFWSAFKHFGSRKRRRHGPT